jgi:uncharacterized RmlC-like cupin family protein
MPCSKTYHIVVERDGVIGNPIIVEDLENEIVTDSNHRKLDVVIITPNWKTAVEFANNPNRQIYVLKGGNKAWYKRKY